MTYPPHKTAVMATKTLANVSEKKALDIGSGAGNDSCFFLEQGFNVVALDKEESSFEFLLQRIPDADRNRIETVKAKMQDFKIQDNHYDLINASFSLPFCNKSEFNVVWKNIRNGLKKGGVFAGQLFGVKDEWNTSENMTFFSSDEVRELIKDFDIKIFDEIDEQGTVADGTAKHWHLFHLVLVKTTTFRL
jgi:ubiquinone/menaquinone biosynthesis C-methylase UbiE